MGSAAAANYFNAIEEEDGGRSNEVEHLLSQFEGAGAAAISRILAGEFPPTPETRRDVSVLLGLQWTRTPRARASVDRVMAEGSRLFLKMLGPRGFEQALSEAGEETAIEEATEIWEGLMDPSRYKIGARQNGQIGLMIDAGVRVAEVFATMKWQLVRFARRPLLTCDHPIGLWRRPGAHDALFGIGPATADLACFPLDRRTALLMRSNASVEDEMLPTTRLAKVINQLWVAGAQRWLYFHPEDNPLAGVMLPQQPG